MTALSPAAAAFYDTVNGAASPDQLDNLGRAVWHHWGKGEFSDDEATFLTGAIDKRRPQRPRPSSSPATVAVGTLNGRLSRFAPRRCRRRLSDEERRKRRERKRMLGGSSAMPDTMRAHYTEGERAALCIVAGEVKRHGICDLSIDEIADRAGVGRTTTQNALHEARRHGHVEITERRRRVAKSLTNLVKITSAEWLTWIKRGPSAAREIGFKYQKSEHLKDHRGEADRRPFEIAREVAAVAGHTMPPKRWTDAQAALTVDGWIKLLASRGIGAHWIVSLCRMVVARKCGEPIHSIDYFTPEILRLVHKQDALRFAAAVVVGQPARRRATQRRAVA